MELKHIQKFFDNINVTLLIVPYGIETLVSEHVPQCLMPFNRTLWN